MLLSILGGGDIQTIIISLLISLPVIMLALAFHETAHGFVAWKCGDNTAYNLGRLTLNPIKHLDPMGLLCMLVFGFGWAKAVPVDTRNFRNPKRGMALTAVAGPAANLLLGAVSAVFYGIALSVWAYFYYTNAAAFAVNCAYWLAQLCYLGAIYNFILMVFNLIPVPPFDGSRIALVFLPPKAYFGIMQYERQIMFGILIALLVIDRFWNFSPFSWVAEQLTNLISSPVCNLTLRLFN